MDSWLVLRSYRATLNQWTTRNDRSFEWLPKTSFIRVSCHQVAEVPSFSLLFQQFHVFGICVVWTCHDSRRDLHKLCRIPKNCQCKWLLVSSRVPGTFESFSGSLVKFCFLHGYAWIHWVARSCTTTAYRWLFRDSQLSLRTLWSAVIKSLKFTARGTASPLRLLHGALVILVRLQVSQFRSSGKWVRTLCLPKSSRLLNVGSNEASWEELAWDYHCTRISSSTKFYLNFWSHSRISEHNDSICSFLDSSNLVFGFYWLGCHQVALTHHQTQLTLALEWCHCWSRLLVLGSKFHLLYVKKTSWKKMMMYDSPVLKVSLKLKIQRTNLTSLEPRLERSSPYCRLSESRFWWDVVVDHWSIRRNIRFHRKAFRATILLACFRRLS